MHLKHLDVCTPSGARRFARRGSFQGAAGSIPSSSSLRLAGQRDANERPRRRRSEGIEGAEAAAMRGRLHRPSGGTRSSARALTETNLNHDGGSFNRGGSRCRGECGRIPRVRETVARGPRTPGPSRDVRHGGSACSSPIPTVVLLRRGGPRRPERVGATSLRRARRIPRCGCRCEWSRRAPDRAERRPPCRSRGSPSSCRPGQCRP